MFRIKLVLLVIVISTMFLHQSYAEDNVYGDDYSSFYEKSDMRYDPEKETYTEWEERDNKRREEQRIKSEQQMKEDKIRYQREQDEFNKKFAEEKNEYAEQYLKEAEEEEKENQKNQDLTGKIENQENQLDQIKEVEELEKQKKNMPEEYVMSFEDVISSVIPSCVKFKSYDTIYKSNETIQQSGVIIYANKLLVRLDAVKNYSQYSIAFNDEKVANGFTTKNDIKDIKKLNELGYTVLNLPYSMYKTLDPVTMSNTDKVKVGEEIFVVSSPQNFTNSVTVGNISKEINKKGLITISAPCLSQGCEGGAVFNNEGVLIGVIDSYSKEIKGCAYVMPIKKIRETF